MKSTREALGYQLPIMGAKHPEILCLDADLSKATKTDTFAKKFPERFFQIGIAEANMIGIASGLSEEIARLLSAALALSLRYSAFLPA